MTTNSNNGLQPSIDNVTPLIAQELFDSILSSIGQIADDIAVSTRTHASVLDGLALANAEAFADALNFEDVINFADGLNGVPKGDFYSALFGENSGYIEGVASLVAEGEASVAAIFSVDPGESVYFEFFETIDLVSSEISKEDEYYIAINATQDLIIASLDENNEVDILAYITVDALLIPTEAIGYVEINYENLSENGELNFNYFVETDIGGENEIDYLFSDIYGSYFDAFINNSSIFIVNYIHGVLEIIGDTLRGLLREKTIYGTKGDDALKGSSVFGDEGNDEISGTGQDNILVGGRGNDMLLGSGGSDSLGGGEGNDVLNGGRGDDYILAGFGDDTIIVKNGEAAGDTMKGGYGWDVLVNEGGGALILSDFGPANSVEEIVGSRRDIRGTSDDDVLDFSATVLDGVPKVDGRNGDDTIRGSQDGDHILGNDGNDEVDGQGGNDELEGNNGADLLLGGDGEDTLIGGSQNDTLVGGADDDVLDGGAGDDENFGGAGDDLIKVRNGEAVNDTFDGGDGWDKLVNWGGGALVLSSFGPDNDVEEIVGSRRDIRGTSDDDVLDFSATVLDGVPKVDGRNGDDTIRGSQDGDHILGNDGNDEIDGQGGDDELEGNNGADLLLGGDGEDTLIGGSQDDTLVGGADNDVLEGGNHNDTVTGGAGADLFVLRGNFGSDVFKDFNPGEGDLIANHNNRRSVESIEFIDGTGYRIDFTRTSDVLTVEASAPDPELEAYLMLL